MKNYFGASFYEFRIPSLLVSVLEINSYGNKQLLQEFNAYLDICLVIITDHQNADG